MQHCTIKVLEPCLAQVLVVVPTLNEAAHIETTITALLEHTDPCVTLVVADGGSTDGTQDHVRALQDRFANLHLMHNSGRRQSAGINAAIRRFAAPEHGLLIRCDAHCHYPKGYIAGVVRAMTQSGAGAVTVPMDAHAETGFARAAAWVVDTPAGSGGAAHRGGRRSGFVDHGHHAGMSLSWFRAIGGYDPSFSHNEDAEYDLRLARAGGRIWLEADLRIGYVMRPSPVALARQYWAYGRGRARTLVKHQALPRLRQLAPVVNLLGMVAALMLALVWPPALLWPGAYLAMLAGLSVLCAVRLRALAGLWAGPAAAIMHNVWAAGVLRQLVWP